MSASAEAVIADTLARLRVRDPQAVERAAGRIDGVLGPVGRSAWPEVAWRFSWLTNTGFPLEFAWSGRDSCIRWTSEVAPPETPDRERLELAGRMAFGGSRVTASRLGAIAALQATKRLRFGAWLGVRHRSDGDEAKVYAELPPVGPAELASALGITPHPVLRTLGLTARMAGLLPDGAVELYTRSTELTEHAVRGLEDSCYGTTDRLWPAVRELVGGQRLPRPSGVSIVFGTEGLPRAVTWFSFAKAVFATDAATAAALSARTRSEASAGLLTALLGGAPDGRWRCGMVGVGVAEAGEAWFQVGMRPS